MLNQKGFTPLIIVLGVGFLAIIASLSFYLGAKNHCLFNKGVDPLCTPMPSLPPLPSPPPPLPDNISPSSSNQVDSNSKTNQTSNPDNNADWKVYTNSKLNFSIKYPPDHTPYEDTDQKKPALIPATSFSDTVRFAAEEGMVFCCEPVTLSIESKSTSKWWNNGEIYKTEEKFGYDDRSKNQIIQLFYSKNK